jgi:hypothetical protein
LASPPRMIARFPPSDRRAPLAGPLGSKNGRGPWPPGRVLLAAWPSPARPPRPAKAQRKPRSQPQGPPLWASRPLRRQAYGTGAPSWECPRLPPDAGLARGQSRGDATPSGPKRAQGGWGALGALPSLGRPGHPLPKAPGPAQNPSPERAQGPAGKGPGRLYGSPLN